MSEAAISVRHCTALAEFEDCVRLQQLTWGEAIVVPSAMFVVTRETGGQILGAFEGQHLIGFTMAVVGYHGKSIFFHSHMTAVEPAWQNRGVGRQLKLFQREDALARGVSLVEWTFDPLELRNAHFNLNRLGAVCRRYIPNFYGITDSPLHAGLPTDRLVAEWHLHSPHVLARLEGKPRERHWLGVRISVPANIGVMRSSDPAAALREQTRIRNEFAGWFAQGYEAVAVEPAVDVTQYILEPKEK